MTSLLLYRATFRDTLGNRLARRIVAAHDNQARIIASSLAKRNGWQVVNVGSHCTNRVQAEKLCRAHNLTRKKGA